MAYIKEDELAKLRTSADIVEIIGSYLKLEKQGINYFAVCPFHDDHKPSMSISPEKQIFTCWTCKESGNVFSFVEKYEHVTFPEAVDIVAKKVGFTLSNNYEKKKDSKYDKYYEILDLAKKFYQNNLKTVVGRKAKDYLTISRKLSDKTISDFEIGLASDEKDILYKLLISKGYDSKDLEYLGLCSKYDDKYLDHFWGRIIFPLADKNGQVVGFTARIYQGEENKSKYVNSKETPLFKKSEILYNYHLAKDIAKKEKFILVVEGQMDAISLYSQGIENVVATSGTALTKEQINLLKQLKCKIYLCFDNDQAGLLATYDNGKSLVDSEIETYVVSYSDVKDPDEYIKKFGKEKFLNLLKQPLKYFDFKLNYLKSKKDMNNNVDVANYINEVLSELTKEKDEILRELTINKLAKEFGLSEDMLFKKVKVIKPSLKKEPIKDIIVNKKNKYDKACEQMLYLMMDNPMYIKIYQKKLGFIPITKYRLLSNEILYYYELYKNINISDFISFVNDKEELNKLVSEIISTVYDGIDSEEEMYLYIKVIKELITKEEIKKLKQSLVEEMDVNKKIDIATKIANLKKGSVENE